jgi:hypothetical protein
VAAGGLDEHHHWVLLHPGQPDELLVDPNGPLRREPYLVRTAELDGRYQDGAEHLVYNPGDDPEDIARRTYPGLLELVGTIMRGTAAGTPEPALPAATGGQRPRYCQR